MPLTDTALRAAKPTEKTQKFFDGNGLYLLITPKGAKSWRLKYRFQGKEKLISLGPYPLVSLKEARERSLVARKTLEGGIDPSAERKQAKNKTQNTFELVAREWHEMQSTKWTKTTATAVMQRMKRNFFPFIGAKPIDEVLPVLKARVTAKKHAVEDGGIILPNGVAIDTAAEDRARVAQIMIMLMQAGSENSLAGLKFKTSTGEFVPVKSDDIKAIYSAIKALTLGVFAREAEITGLLDAAEHADEAIEAYEDEIGKGWPVTDMRPAAAPAATETTTTTTTEEPAAETPSNA